MEVLHLVRAKTVCATVDVSLVDPSSNHTGSKFYSFRSCNYRETFGRFLHHFDHILYNQGAFYYPRIQYLE